jgi:hypothetical protein
MNFQENAGTLERRFLPVRFVTAGPFPGAAC